MQRGRVVTGILVLLQRGPIALGLDRQQADAFDRLGHFVEVRQVDGTEEQVVDVQTLWLFLEHLELVAARRRGFRHHGLGVGNRHRAGQAHEQVVGVEANGFADVDASATEIVLVVVSRDRLRRQNVENLLRDVLVGVLFHRVDVDVLNVAVIAFFGIPHDVVGDQHHGVPWADTAHDAGFAAVFVGEVIGEVPLFRQVFAQQATGVDVQRLGHFAAVIGNVRQHADAAGEDRLEDEGVTALAVVLIHRLGVERLVHVRVLLGQAEFRGHARTGTAAGTEDREIQARLVGLDPAAVDQVRVNHFPVRAGETLGVLVQDDLGQVLTEDRRVTGATGVDFRQVHDLHFAVVAQEATLFALARETDATGDVFVQVAEHHQRLDQEHRFGGLVRPQAQVVANPLRRAVTLFGVTFVRRQAVFVVEFVEVELAGVVHQLSDVERNVRSATSQADQAHRREFLIAVLFVVAFQVRWAREHHVAQAIEVIEDAVGVGFGEIQVLLTGQRT